MNLYPSETKVFYELFERFALSVPKREGSLKLSFETCVLRPSRAVFFSALGETKKGLETCEDRGSNAKDARRNLKPHYGLLLLKTSKNGCPNKCRQGDDWDTKGEIKTL